MKLNYNFLQFFKSTFVVSVISSLIGLSAFLAGKSFWPAFLLATGCQYVVFSGIINTINNYLTLQARQKELDKLEPLSTILECAVCKTQNVITFIPDQNERFEFTCENEKCKSKNVVSINFTVAKVTEFKDPMQIPSKI
jgi:hypothetical protein